MDYRTEGFRKKFTDAARQFKVKTHQIVSLKVRENVNSYAEYHEFLHTLEHNAGIRFSPVNGDFQGKGYLISDGSSQVIMVEHETGLEILYIAGSIASLVSLVPLVLQGWRAFRGRSSRRHDMDVRDVEIRRLDEKGNLSEDHIRDMTTFSSVLPMAQMIEKDLHQIMDQIQVLTDRVEVLEKKKEAPTKKHKSRAGKKKRAK